MGSRVYTFCRTPGTKRDNAQAIWHLPENASLNRWRHLEQKLSPLRCEQKIGGVNPPTSNHSIAERSPTDVGWINYG